MISTFDREMKNTSFRRMFRKSYRKFLYTELLMEGKSESCAIAEIKKLNKGKKLGGDLSIKEMKRAGSKE